MIFSMDDIQLEKLRVWSEAQDKNVAEKQGLAKPNYGCNGGSLTYMFTPTSIGLILRVVNEYTHQSIDLTDYNSW